MVSKPSNLLNLLASGLIKRHQPTFLELNTHITEAKDELKGANALEVRKFKGRYEASHLLGLAALKMRGYQPLNSFGNRGAVFSCLEHAVPATENDSEVFKKASEARNKSDYEGIPVNYSESQIEALDDAVKNLEEEVDLMFRQWKSEHANGFKP